MPSGYLLKAVFLHSGEAITRYSDPLYDQEPTRFPSFELLSEPVDVFQGLCSIGYDMPDVSNVLLISITNYVQVMEKYA